MITAAVRELSFGQAINEAIRQEMRRDPTIIVMGEDVAGGAGRAHHRICRRGQRWRVEIGEWRNDVQARFRS